MNNFSLRPLSAVLLPMLVAFFPALLPRAHSDVDIGGGILVFGGPELAPATTIELRFPAPMVAREQLGPAAESPLAISPDLPGEFTWLSTRSGVFVPDGPLPLGGQWTAQLRTGLADAQGQPLAPTTPFVLTTPAFAMTVANPGTWGDRDVSPRVEPRLAFNAAVDMQSAVASLRFVDAGGRSVPAEVRNATTSDYFPLRPEQDDWHQRWQAVLDPGAQPAPGLSTPGEPTPLPNRLLVSPATPLPPGEGWRLTANAGIRSADGAFATTEPIDVPLGVVQPFELTSLEALNFINSGTALRAVFNQAIAPDITADNVGDFFRVEPAPDNLEWEVDWQGVTARGNFLLGQEYRFLVGDRVVGGDGRPFAGPREQAAVFSPVAPRLYLPDITGQQLRFGRREFPTRHINLEALRLRAVATPPEGIAAALEAFKAYRKSDWDEENPDEFFQPLPPDAIPGRVLFDGALELPAAATDEAGDYTVRWNELLGDNAPGAVFLTLEGKPLPGLEGKSAGAQAFVQLTDLGLLWKQDRAGLHVLVFSMQSGEPIANAHAVILDEQLAELADGRTAESGRVRIPFSGVPAWLSVRTDGDAHVIRMGPSASELPVWAFRIPVAYPAWDSDPAAEESLRGFLFTDRPLYRAGETVQVKGILRNVAGEDFSMAAGVAGRLILFGPNGEETAMREVSTGPNGDFAASFPAPDGRSGEYRIGFRPGDQSFGWWQATAQAVLLIADYQPDAFEIDLEVPTTVAAGQEPPPLTVRGSYLFGGVLADASLRWVLQTRRTDFAPEGFGEFVFLAESSRSEAARTLSGELALPSGKAATIPADWVELQAAPLLESLAVEVTDLNQQTVAREKSFLRHASDFYLGIAPWERGVFPAGKPIEARVVAVSADGRPLPVPVEFNATWIFQRNDVVRIQGAGNTVAFQTSKTEEPVAESSGRTVPAQRSANGWEAGDGPAVAFTPDRPGSYILRVEAKDAGGRGVISESRVYVAGPGETVWDYRNPAQIDLIPDRQDYAPGDTAKILLKSPISGTAVVTVERGNAIRRVWMQTVEGNAPVIEVPLEAADSPNVFVSVMILRGADASKRKFPEPDFRYGISQLTVRDPADKLAVTIQPQPASAQPGQAVQAKILVSGADGKPAAQAAVTFFAVDDGVLSLVGYERPNPLPVFQAALPLGVRTGISLDNLLPENPEAFEFSNKGYLIGGGGLAAAGLKFRENFPGTICWLPDLVTDANGEVTVEFAAPDALTRYRLVAVAHQGPRRFGSGESSFTISKPLLLLSGLGTFARVGDELIARVVVRNQTGTDAEVRLDWGLPPGIEAVGGTPATLRMPDGASTPVDLPLRFTKSGPARIEWTATATTAGQTFSDALAVTLDVSSPMLELRETYLPDFGAGQTNLLAGINPQLQEGSGQAVVTVASTRLAGIGESASYLLEYPYGCAEQTVSSLIPWLARGLAPLLPELDPANQSVSDAIAEGVSRLFRMQTEAGGIAFWPGQTRPSVPVSAWAAVALAGLPGDDVEPPRAGLDALLGYLSRSLREELSERDLNGLTDRALTLYALALHGRPEPAYAEGLLAQAGRLPAEARRLLALALARNGGEDNLESARGLLATPSAAAETFNIFGSPGREAAIDLLALATVDPGSSAIARRVAELLDLRRGGRWENTQANAWAILALAKYYTTVEAPAGSPQGRGLILHDHEKLPFEVSSERPAIAADLAWDGRRAGAQLAVDNQTKHQLFGRASFRIHPPLGEQPRQDRGFAVSRSYRKLLPDGSSAGLEGLRVGDRVLVTIRVETSLPGLLVAVEDPLPSVLEAVNPEFQSSAAGLPTGMEAHPAPVSYREVRADRVLFFSDQLPPGAHYYQYLARVRSAGTGRAPAPKAEEMYRPERFGLGEIQILNVAGP